MADQSMTGHALRQMVAEKILAANLGVGDRVVQHFVDAEIDRRASLIIKMVDKLKSIMSERRKLDKQDAVTYDREGTRHEFWTEDRRKQQIKLDEKIQKCDSAIRMALAEANYDAVEKLVKGDGSN